MPVKNVIKKSSLSPTVLIVGGAGFIGSHLAEALLEKNARVVVIDNFDTDKDIHIHKLLENPKFALFNVDINSGLPKEIQSVDYIFYLAGLESYLFDKDNISLDSLLATALGTKNILDFAKASNAKFLLASSIDVYKGMISPLDLNHYFGQTEEEEQKYSLAEAKRYSEALVWEYYKKHDVDVRIARLPDVYGPRMNTDSCGSLGKLIRSLIDHKDLTVYGEGTSKEYYLYISDAVSGLIKSLFSENTRGNIYTLVGEESHTALGTTYLIRSLAVGESRVVFKQKSGKIEAQEPRIPDRSSLKDIDWEERVDFRDGIVKTLKWFGYEPNEHPFKPSKLVENKEKESVQSSEQLFSIADISPKPSSEPSVTNLSSTPSAPQTPTREQILARIQPPNISGFTKALNYLRSIVRLPFGKSNNEIVNSSINMNPTSMPSKKVATYGFIASIVFIAFAIFLGLPAAQTYYYTKKGASNFENIKSALIDLDTEQSKDLSNSSFVNFYKAQDSLDRLKWAFYLVGKKDLFNDYQIVLHSAEKASKASYFISKGSKPFVTYWQNLSPDLQHSFNPDEFEASKADFLTAQENLRIAHADLTQVDLSSMPSEVSNYSEILEDLGIKMDLLVYLSQDFTSLVGADGKKSYLVLFQNSNEIRPTGGFIGSYATVEMENGAIANLIIDDVYNPDGQIDVQAISVPSPDPIKDYLGEDRQHIRNANWDPNFLESSRQITELFYEVDGRVYDGVFAIDLNFVKSLLEVTGPIYLTAYDETITAENLYERTQFHSEFNYQPGSDQKRSFLTILGGKMLERIFSLSNSELLAMTEVVQKSLIQKNLLVNLPNQSISALLSREIWDGSMASPGGDYLYVVNANLGGTKANYYVKNEMSYNVTSNTRDGLLRSELVLTYNHTGVDNVWPGGPYTNYLRVFTKKGTKLTGALLNIEGRASVNIFEDVLINEDTEYTVYEFPFVIEPQEKAHITFEYDLPKDLSISSKDHDYSLFWQKQAGTQGDFYEFSFAPPLGLVVDSVYPTIGVEGSAVKGSGNMNSDKFFEIKLK